MKPKNSPKLSVLLVLLNSRILLGERVWCLGLSQYWPHASQSLNPCESSISWALKYLFNGKKKKGSPSAVLDAVREPMTDETRSDGWSGSVGLTVQYSEDPRATPDDVALLYPSSQNTSVIYKILALRNTHLY